jgi:glutathione S-transferase
LPYLVVDSVKLPQSLAIARLLAKRFNLAGSDDLEQAKTDAVIDTVNDLQNSYYEKLYYVKEGRAEAEKKYLSEDGKSHLGKVEKIISLYGSGGFSVGSSLKWSDLFIFDITSIIHGLDEKFLDNYPAIKAVRATVLANAKIAEYVKNRAEKPF